MFLLTVSASRSLTVPIAAMTYSLRSSSALSCAAAFDFAIEDHLRHAGAVAQINKNKIAEVAPAVDPSHEHSFFPSVRRPQRSAHVGAA